jgi:hypothetical protein
MENLLRFEGWSRWFWQAKPEIVSGPVDRYSGCDRIADVESSIFIPRPRKKRRTTRVPNLKINRL